MGVVGFDSGRASCWLEESRTPARARASTPPPPTKRQCQCSLRESKRRRSIVFIRLRSPFACQIVARLSLSFHNEFLAPATEKRRRTAVRPAGPCPDHPRTGTIRDLPD